MCLNAPRTLYLFKSASAYFRLAFWTAEQQQQKNETYKYYFYNMQIARVFQYIMNIWMYICIYRRELFVYTNEK